MRDFERLARITDKQLPPGADSALMNAEDAEAADEGIDVDFENVSNDVKRRIGHDLHTFRSDPLAAQERRRIALHWVGHQAREYLQQLFDTDAGLGGHETNRDQMAFTQRALERVVQLLRRQLLALFQVQLHQIFIDLDHLIDDFSVRGFDRRKIRLQLGGCGGLKKTIDHGAPTL